MHMQVYAYAYTSTTQSRERHSNQQDVVENLYRSLNSHNIMPVLLRYYTEMRRSHYKKQEAQLMLTTGSTRLAVSRGQQTWYHSTCYI